MLRKLLSLAAMLLATQTQAAPVLYTDEAAYLAAVGATTTYVDFAGSPAATVSGASFTPAVTFGSCTTNFASCGNQVLHNSDAITDLGGSAAPNGVSRLGGAFTDPVWAFAFHYISGGVTSVELNGGALNVVVDPINGFLGIVSDVALTDFVGINAVFPNNIGNDRYFIDDFRINNRVPEPATLALVLASLVVTGGLRRRR